jgi:hypothetical protein
MIDVLSQTGADPEHHPRPSRPAGVVAVPYPHGGRAGVAGVNLAKATDLLDERYGLGGAGRDDHALGRRQPTPVPCAVVLRDAVLCLTRPSSHPSGPLTDDPFS